MKVISDTHLKRTHLGQTISHYKKEMTIESKSGARLVFDATVSAHWGTSPSDCIFDDSEIKTEITPKQIQLDGKFLNLLPGSKFGMSISETLNKGVVADFVRAETVLCNEEVGNEVTMKYVISSELAQELKDKLNDYLLPMMTKKSKEPEPESLSV
jgi:hypothetical protein